MNRMTMIGAFGVLAATLLAPVCNAQCGGGRMAHTSGLVPTGGVRLLAAAFAQDEEDRNDRGTGDPQKTPLIVGFWRQQLIAQGVSGIPDGTVVDDDLAQWHSDHTEVQNTRLRTPASGNICFGVWEQTGRRTFRLNHFAQAFDPTGTNYAGIVNIQEDIIVSGDGKTYSGTFTLNAFDPMGGSQAQLKGAVKGTLITMQTTPHDLL